MGPAGAFERHGQSTAGGKVGEAPKMESSWGPSQCLESSQFFNTHFAMAIRTAWSVEMLGGLRFQKIKLSRSNTESMKLIGLVFSRRGLEDEYF